MYSNYTGLCFYVKFEKKFKNCSNTVRAKGTEARKAH